MCRVISKSFFLLANIQILKLNKMPTIKQLARLADSFKNPWKLAQVHSALKADEMRAVFVTFNIYLTVFWGELTL